MQQKLLDEKSPVAAGDGNEDMINSNSPLNIDQINTFFKFLYDDPHEIFTGCFLDCYGKEVIKGCGVVFETAEEFAKLAHGVWVSTKGSPHVCLNRTSLNGRRTRDIQSTRVLCVDLDEPHDRDWVRGVVTDYGVHMVVESSPGKFHLYWKLESGSVGLEEWSLFQLGLARRLGGDQNFRDITKTIRVPGVPRVTKDGGWFTPRIVYFAPEHEVLDRGAVLEMWPWIIEEAEKGEKERKQRVRKIHRAVDSGDIKKIGLLGSGHRNETLFEAVYRRTIEHGNSEETLRYGYEVAQQLKEVESGHPFDDREIEKTIDSAVRRGMEAREEMKVRKAEEAGKLEELIEKEVSGNGLNGHHEGFKYDFTAPLLVDNRFSQIGIAGRVLQKYKGSIVRTGKIVYAFDHDDKTWSPQRTNQEIITGYVIDCIQDAIRSEEFLKEFCGAANPKKGKEEVLQARNRHQMQFLSNNFISGARAQLMCIGKDIPQMLISDFDKEDTWLHTKNGVIDMRAEGQFWHAKPTDYLLRRSSVAWNEKATCEGWLEFLSQVFSENDDPPELIEFIQEVFGYTLSGSNAARVIFIHWGDGSNGKSKVLKALSTVLGDYCSMMGCNSLAKKNNAVQREIERIGVKIEGRRAVIIDDLETKTQWNDGYVKMLTEDKLPMRKLYEEERDIPNRAKFHIGCNHAPEPEGQDYAILRRMVFIPYNRRFTPESSADRRIEAMLRDEAEGILRWSVEGFRRLEARGMNFKYPSEVAYSLETYRQEHFTSEAEVESIINLIFKPAPTEAEENWHEVGELMKVLNQALKAKGLNARVHANQAGRLFRAKFPQKKTRMNGVQARRYLLIINNDFNKLTDLL